MVYFQCENCCETLKKKQVEPHYQFRCRMSHSFSCLTCGKVFDRQAIVAHTSCVTEDQKYKSTDKKFMAQGKNKNGNHKNTNGDVKNFNSNETSNIGDAKILADHEKIKDLTWSGYKKTALKLLKNLEIKQLKVGELTRYLIKIYLNAKK